MEHVFVIKGGQPLLIFCGSAATFDALDPALVHIEGDRGVGYLAEGRGDGPVKDDLALDGIELGNDVQLTGEEVHSGLRGVTAVVGHHVLRVDEEGDVGPGGVVDMDLAGVSWILATAVITFRSWGVSTLPTTR